MVGDPECLKVAAAPILKQFALLTLVQLFILLTAAPEVVASQSKTLRNFGPSSEFNCEIFERGNPNNQDDDTGNHLLLAFFCGAWRADQQLYQ